MHIKQWMSLAIAAALAACGSSSSIEGTEENTAATEKAPLQRVALGKPGKAAGLELTVKSVSLTNQIGTKGFGPAAGAGETFVVVRYNIKNVGTKPIEGSDLPVVELLDSKDTVFAEDTDAAILAAALDNSLQTSNTANPNVTVKLVAVWKVDKAAFDKATWRLKVSFDRTLSAMFDKAVAWPMDAQSTPPLTFELK